MRDFFYCLIFPHPANNHRARVLHPKAFLLLIAFFVGASMLAPKVAPSSFRIEADVSVQQLLDLTNQKRREGGVSALTLNKQLSVAASRKADDMMKKNYWAHVSPDGLTPWVFIKQSGYNYVYAGENLARGFSNSNDVVNAWMASPDHRTNVLSPNFKDVGFAVKGGRLGGEETLLVVQEFGSRNLVPVAAKAAKPKTKKVLAFSFSPPASYRPNLSVSSELTILVMLTLIAVLMIDIVRIDRKRVVRFVGHNADHAIFLILIVVVIAVFNMGAVI